MSYDYTQHWNNSVFEGGVPIPSYLEQIKKWLIPGSTLDVGCAYGRLSQVLPEPYTGIDISPMSIKTACELYPDKEFYQADIVNWMTSRRWDNILTWTVLQHIPDTEIGKAADNLKRLAKNLIVLETTTAGPLAAHCFSHDYENLFTVTEKVDLGGGTHLYKARGNA